MKRKELILVAGCPHFGHGQWNLVAIMDQGQHYLEENLDEIYYEAFGQKSELGDGLGPFENLEEVEVFGLGLCQSFGKEGFRLLTAQEFNELKINGLAANEFWNKVREKGKWVKSLNSSPRSKILRRIFN